MSKKGLNLFDECAAECVHLCPREEYCASSSQGDSKGPSTNKLHHP